MGASLLCYVGYKICMVAPVITVLIQTFNVFSEQFFEIRKVNMNNFMCELKKMT